MPGKKPVHRSRLSTAFPDLDAVIQANSPDIGLKAAWVAARWAVKKAKLAHPAIAAAHEDGPVREVSRLVKQLDKQYFDQQEAWENGQGTKAEWLATFRQARAASAIEFAIRGEAAEAIYE